MQRRGDRRAVPPKPAVGPPLPPHGQPLRRKDKARGSREKGRNMEFWVFPLRISPFSASPVLRQRQSVANPAGRVFDGRPPCEHFFRRLHYNKHTGIVPFRAVGSFFCPRRQRFAVWWRWFPWKQLVSRAARSRGFVDPVKLLARLS